MATINQVYNYYLASYPRTGITRYDSHKRSELRSLYNTIVKLNRESPLYKVDFSEDMQKYVIDIKESARNIKNVVAAISDGADNIDSGFQRKIASSSQEDVVSVSFVGHSKDADELSSFEIEVKKLATPQINLGNFLPSQKAVNLEPGTYSFDLDVGNLGYEFQFTINKGNTNLEIQRKLADLINESNIGLTAQVIGEDRQESSLEIKSYRTGISNYSRSIFKISESNNSNLKGSVSYFGIDEISEYPENSSFLLNGLEKSSYGNTFTVSKTFEITLHNVCEEGKPAAIGLKTAEDTLADNVHELITAYNSALQMTEKHSSNPNNTGRFRSDIRFVARQFSMQLEPIGLTVQDNGCIYIDKQLLMDAITAEDAKENFSILKDFKNVLKVKADKAMLDPMDYVDKTLVAYKNFGKSFVNPYASCIYSGMMFNSYC